MICFSPVEYGVYLTFPAPGLGLRRSRPYQPLLIKPLFNFEPYRRGIVSICTNEHISF